jgi:hypothetical protein
MFTERVGFEPTRDEPQANRGVPEAPPYLRCRRANAAPDPDLR